MSESAAGDAGDATAPDAGETGSTAAGGDPDASYSGIFGAVPYAFRASDSRLFRSYVVLGGLVAAFVTVIFTFALIGVVASTTGTVGGSFTFSRSFFIFIGFLVVFALLGPIISVARRHRRGTTSDWDTTRADAVLAATGYLFVLALYLGLVISTPEAQQESVSGALAPVATFLYGLPRLLGLVPPTLVGVGIYLLHRRMR